MIIIPDGAADLPIEELGGRTPFEAARTPNLDRLAAMGRIGTAHTTPEPFGPGSDVCCMSLLGYDPRKYHSGRAPIEALALGIPLVAQDWIFRVNLVTVSDDGEMVDHSAGGIDNAEARTIIADLEAHWREQAPEIMAGATLYPGESYRNILVDGSGRTFADLVTVPPHEIPGEGWEPHLPSGGAGAEPIARLMRLSQQYLKNHELNRLRTEQGLRPANMAWIWGQGTSPDMPSFADKFRGPARGAMITSVDLLRGIARGIGWDVLDVKGLTSYHDTDYGAQGVATVRAIDDFDIVCTHIESTDEASHQADVGTKLAALERIDEAIVGPVLQKLETFGDPEVDPGATGWRVLVLPDHYTLVSTRKHDATPVPFAMAGAWVRSVVNRRLTEADADESDLDIGQGHELMEYFLRSGRAGVR